MRKVMVANGRKKDRVARRGRAAQGGIGNSISTFETRSTDGKSRRWTWVDRSSSSSRWLGGGSVRSRRSSKKGRKARGMGLQQMVARQKEGRGDTLVKRRATAAAPLRRT